MALKEAVKVINEKTVMSLHVVVMLLGLTTWLIQLKDHVEDLEKRIHYLEKVICTKDNTCH